MIPPSHPDRSRQSGFTLVEMLVVITIIGILVALLLPVIAGAVRTANEARVTGEINTIAQSLASFKTKYGDFPPSRIILCEDGYYDTAGPLPPPGWFNAGGGGSLNYAAPDLDIGAQSRTPSNTDLTYGQLAERSLRYLRKFFPRVPFSTTRRIVPINAYGDFHDFNGDGAMNPGTIYLEGHECLVFFLGGIPSIGPNDAGTGLEFGGLSGFANNPQNPFVKEYYNNMYQYPNRVRPIFEFKGERLVDDDRDGIPGYIDSLGSSSTGRYFAYFSSYGGGGYDPNDVNFNPITLDESDLAGRPFRVNFPVVLPGNPPTTINEVFSPVPNPYTSSQPASATGAPATYQNSETYQIISSGGDRRFGPGGQYLSNSTDDRLPVDAAVTDRDLRVREQDNLSNFAAGRFQ